MGSHAEAAPIFVDTFEAGTPNTNIPGNGTPWRVSDIVPAMYRSAGNPFSTGSVYAELTDPGTGTNPSQAVRLLSSNAADAGGLGPQIAGKVTTFSFQFWEPLPHPAADNQPGLGFGYYKSGTIDFNAAGRNFRALLHNGLLSPDSLVAGTGAPVAYAGETVHTVFMMANDSAAPVVDYSGGQTLDPGQADVWISLGGAAPVFAFSVNKQNAGDLPHGVGFRTFNPDVEQFRIDNVLLVAGATFDRSEIPEPGSAGLLAAAVAGIGVRMRSRRGA
jgi:hypothetical protein